MTNLAWSEERVSRLVKLWSEGLSASQIACDLGGTTRNAVIGVVHRKGLQRGGNQNLIARAVRVRRAPTPPREIAPVRQVAAQPLRIKRAPKKPRAPKAEKPAPKFDNSPASLAAMALLGVARTAEKRRDGFRAAAVR